MLNTNAASLLVAFGLEWGWNKAHSLRCNILAIKNGTLQVRLTEDKSAVEMSKILMWYRKDFGNDDAAVITTVAGQVFDFDLNWLLIILNLQKQNEYV